MKDTCADFAGEITKHFDYLIRDQGFRFVETRLSRGERCVLFLESTSFRIKFHFAPDEIQVQLGRHDAPLIWAEKVDGHPHWHHLKSIVGFLHNDREVRIPDSDSWAKMTHERQIIEHSKALRENFEAVEELFGEGGLESRRASYEEYLRHLAAKAREEYAALAHGKKPAR